jgi:hypothetical protein
MSEALVNVRRSLQKAGWPPYVQVLISVALSPNDF